MDLSAHRLSSIVNTQKDSKFGNSQYYKSSPSVPGRYTPIVCATLPLKVRLIDTAVLKYLSRTTSYNVP